MESDSAILDSLILKLNPTKTRCEVIAFIDKAPTPVATGLVKHYASHIGAVAKQLQSGSHVILLDPRSRSEYSDGSPDGPCYSWFTLRTIRRVANFVENPATLTRLVEMNTELSQLEASLPLSFPGGSDYASDNGPPRGMRSMSSSRPSSPMRQSARWASDQDDDSTDANPRRGIEARIAMLRREFHLAIARANASGFNAESMGPLLCFADCFGAERLRRACTDFQVLLQKKDIREGRGYAAGMPGTLRVPSVASSGPGSPRLGAERGDPLDGSLLVPGLGHAQTAPPYLFPPAMMPGQPGAGMPGVYQQQYYGHPYLNHPAGMGAGSQHLFLGPEAGAPGVGIGALGVAGGLSGIPGMPGATGVPGVPGVWAPQGAGAGSPLAQRSSIGPHITGAHSNSVTHMTGVHMTGAHITAAHSNSVTGASSQMFYRDEMHTGSNYDSVSVSSARHADGTGGMGAGPIARMMSSTSAVAGNGTLSRGSGGVGVMNGEMGSGNDQVDAPPMELLGRLQRSRSATRSVNGAAPRRPSVVACSPRAPRVSSTGAGSHSRPESPGVRSHKALSQPHGVGGQLASDRMSDLSLGDTDVDDAASSCLSVNTGPVPLDSNHLGMGMGMGMGMGVGSNRIGMEVYSGASSNSSGYNSVPESSEESSGCIGGAQDIPLHSPVTPPSVEGPFGKVSSRTGPGSQMSPVKKKSQELQVFLNSLAKPQGRGASPGPRRPLGTPPGAGPGSPRSVPTGPGVPAGAVPGTPQARWALGSPGGGGLGRSFALQARSGTPERMPPRIPIPGLPHSQSGTDMQAELLGANIRSTVQAQHQSQLQSQYPSQAATLLQYSSQAATLLQFQSQLQSQGQGVLEQSLLSSPKQMEASPGCAPGPSPDMRPLPGTSDASYGGPPTLLVHPRAPQSPNLMARSGMGTDLKPETQNLEEGVSAGVALEKHALSLVTAETKAAGREGDSEGACDEQRQPQKNAEPQGQGQGRIRGQGSGQVQVQMSRSGSSELAGGYGSAAEAEKKAGPQGQGQGRIQGQVQMSRSGSSELSGGYGSAAEAEKAALKAALEVALRGAARAEEAQREASQDAQRDAQREEAQREEASKEEPKEAPKEELWQILERKQMEAFKRREEAKRIADEKTERERQQREELRQQRERMRRASPARSANGWPAMNHYAQHQQLNFGQRPAPLSPSRAFERGTYSPSRHTSPGNQHREGLIGAVSVQTRAGPGQGLGLRSASREGSEYGHGSNAQSPWRERTRGVGSPVRDFSSGPGTPSRIGARSQSVYTPSSRNHRQPLGAVGAPGGPVASRGAQSPARDRDQLPSSSRGTQSPSSDPPSGPNTPSRIGARSQSVYTPSGDRPQTQPGARAEHGSSQGGVYRQASPYRGPPRAPPVPLPASLSPGEGGPMQHHRERPGSPQVHRLGSPSRGPRIPQPPSWGAGEQGMGMPGSPWVYQGSGAAAGESSLPGAGAGDVVESPGCIVGGSPPMADPPGIHASSAAGSEGVSGSETGMDRGSFQVSSVGRLESEGRHSGQATSKATNAASSAVPSLLKSEKFHSSSGQATHGQALPRVNGSGEGTHRQPLERAQQQQLVPRADSCGEGQASGERPAVPRVATTGSNDAAAVAQGEGVGLSEAEGGSTVGGRGEGPGTPRSRRGRFSLRGRTGGVPSRQLFPSLRSSASPAPDPAPSPLARAGKQHGTVDGTPEEPLLQQEGRQAGGCELSGAPSGQLAAEGHQADQCQEWCGDVEDRECMNAGDNEGGKEGDRKDREEVSPGEAEGAQPSGEPPVNPRHLRRFARPASPGRIAFPRIWGRDRQQSAPNPQAQSSCDAVADGGREEGEPDRGAASGYAHHAPGLQPQAQEPVALGGTEPASEGNVPSGTPPCGAPELGVPGAGVQGEEASQEGEESEVESSAQKRPGKPGTPTRFRMWGRDRHVGGSSRAGAGERAGTGTGAGAGEGEGAREGEGTRLGMGIGSPRHVAAGHVATGLRRATASWDSAWQGGAKLLVARRPYAGGAAGLGLRKGRSGEREERGEGEGDREGEKEHAEESPGRNHGGVENPEEVEPAAEAEGAVRNRRADGPVWVEMGASERPVQDQIHTVPCSSGGERVNKVREQVRMQGGRWETMPGKAEEDEEEEVTDGECDEVIEMESPGQVGVQRQQADGSISNGDKIFRSGQAGAEMDPSRALLSSFEDWSSLAGIKAGEVTRGSHESFAFESLPGGPGAEMSPRIHEHPAYPQEQVHDQGTGSGVGWRGRGRTEQSMGGEGEEEGEEPGSPVGGAGEEDENVGLVRDRGHWNSPGVPEDGPEGFSARAEGLVRDVSGCSPQGVLFGTPEKSPGALGLLRDASRCSTLGVPGGVPEGVPVSVGIIRDTSRCSTLGAPMEPSVSIKLTLSARGPSVVGRPPGVPGTAGGGLAGAAPSISEEGCWSPASTDFNPSISSRAGRGAGAGMGGLRAASTKSDIASLRTDSSRAWTASLKIPSPSVSANTSASMRDKAASGNGSGIGSGRDRGERGSARPASPHRRWLARSPSPGKAPGTPADLEMDERAFARAPGAGPVIPPIPRCATSTPGRTDGGAEGRRGQRCATGVPGRTGLGAVGEDGGVGSRRSSRGSARAASPAKVMVEERQGREREYMQELRQKALLMEKSQEPARGGGIRRLFVFKR